MGSVPKCPFTPSGPRVIASTSPCLISIFIGTPLTGPCGIVTVTVPEIEKSPFVEVALDTWRSDTTCLCMLVPSGLIISNLARNFRLPACAPVVGPPVVLLVMFDDVLLDVAFDEPVDVAFAPVVAVVLLLPVDVALPPVDVLLLPVEVLLLAPPTVAERPPVLLLPVEVLLPPAVVALPPAVALPPVVLVELPPVIVWPRVEVPVELPPELVLLPPEDVELPLVAPPVVAEVPPVLLPPTVPPVVEVLLPPAVVELVPPVLLVLLVPEVVLVELLAVALLVELLVELAAPPLVMLDISKPFMYQDPA